MSQNIILLSIKPIYVDKIFSGEKTVELRKVIPKALGTGDIVIVYASSPKKCIYGAFSVKKVIKGSPTELSERLIEKACIPPQDYFEYFDGKNYAYAIFIDQKIVFEEQTQLYKLRELLGGFRPPQNFRYLTPSEIALESINIDVLV